MTSSPFKVDISALNAAARAIFREGDAARRAYEAEAPAVSSARAAHDSAAATALRRAIGNSPDALMRQATGSALVHATSESFAQKLMQDLAREGRETIRDSDFSAKALHDQISLRSTAQAYVRDLAREHYEATLRPATTFSAAQLDSVLIK